MEINFKGKTALVTGAGDGIGRAIAKRLLMYGATVFALSRTAAHLESLKQELPEINILQVDLQDWEKTAEAVQSIGRVDVLVNNAAVASLESFLDVTPESFDRAFNVNVKAVINVSQIVAKSLIKDKVPGAIVNISSQASQVALKDHTVYCATKGALDTMTKVMALELGSHKIRVNCVNPTVVMTEMGKIAWSAPEKANPMLSRIPLGRFAEIDEVVDAVVFLLSDRASMINAATLPVDGGFWGS